MNVVRKDDEQLSANLGYFHRVQAQTPTRLWINNPSGVEIEQAIAAGARNITTNPAYCSKLIKSEPEYLQRTIDDIIVGVKDNDIAADLVYQKVASRIMEQFSSFYKESNGRDGYVTIQADPRLDDDTGAIVSAAIRHSRLGENYMAKIPVTRSGMQAIEKLLEMGVPICATEVFSISQAIQICELYQRVTAKNGKRPIFYVTHITGIFDEYLQRLVKHNGTDIPLQLLQHAGCVVARKQYRMMKERGYGIPILGGGARGTQHFTEFVGGDMHITINWSTAEELIKIDGSVVNRIGTEISENVIGELRAKLPDFCKAYDEDALSLEDFESYGPVKLFRNNFIEGYYRLLAEVCVRRAQLLL